MSNTITDRKRWTVRRIAFSIGTFVLAGVLTIAAAAYLFDAGLEGGGETMAMDARWVGEGPVASIGNEPHYPGDTFTFEGKVALPEDSTGQAYMMGLRLPGLPEGYTAKITEGCGNLVTKTGTNVTIRFDVAQDAPGGSWSLKPGAGATLSPSEQVTNQGYGPCSAPVQGGQQ